MSMKYILILFMNMWIMQPLFGQRGLRGSDIIADSSAHAAADVLRRTAAVFEQSGGMSLNFRVSAPEGEQTGTIYLKGECFRLDTPMMTTWFDGKTQWTYVMDNEEVNVSEPTAEEMQGLNPYAWLKIWEKGYRLRLLKESAKQVSVQMSAMQNKQQIVSMVVVVDKRTFMPMRISLVPRGSRQATVVQVNKYEVRQKYDNSFFVFDAKKFPQAEIIDLR